MADTPSTADFLSVADAPAIAMGMVYVAGADSIGLAMANAVAAQQRGQVLGGAALAQILVLIVAKGGAS
ncbi:MULTISPECIES: RebB family R body protein [unclassified Sphingomonas]|uniref:RebB family R body protein n=1 Tax=unclassified Sphingomonas TaxID=196159 RepID=UPI001F5734AB|nr:MULTISPECIES: RebB family R body protein [unclassified Sphingomonas]